MNLSIKYEGIKLKKCLIACKKDIDVVVGFQYSEIGWLKNSTFHSQSSFAEKVTKMTQKDPLKIIIIKKKSFKTWLKKMTIPNFKKLLLYIV